MAASRLLLDIIPVADTKKLFRNKHGLIQRLFKWAESGPEPIQSYSAGLLAAAMDLRTLAMRHQQQNTKMVPIILERLWEIQKKIIEEGASASGKEVPLLGKRLTLIVSIV